jgi:hypothetical protein
MSRTIGIPIEDRPVPNPEPTEGLPEFNGPDMLTLGEAARLCRYKPQTIRDAIKRGELPGFIPRGRLPGKTGPGNGYRIFRSDLQRWYFGSMGVDLAPKEEEGNE